MSVLRQHQEDLLLLLLLVLVPCSSTLARVRCRHKGKRPQSSQLGLIRFVHKTIDERSASLTDCRCCSSSYSCPRASCGMTVRARRQHVSASDQVRVTDVSSSSSIGFYHARHRKHRSAWKQPTASVREQRMERILSVALLSVVIACLGLAARLRSQPQPRLRHSVYRPSPAPAAAASFIPFPSLRESSNVHTRAATTTVVFQKPNPFIRQQQEGDTLHTVPDYGGLSITPLEPDQPSRTIREDNLDPSYTDVAPIMGYYYAFDDDLLRNPDHGFADYNVTVQRPIGRNHRCRRTQWHRYQYPTCNALHEMASSSSSSGIVDLLK